MGFLSFFLGEKKQTASVAKERLQFILAHETSGRGRGLSAESRADLQQQLLAVITKFFPVNPSAINVQVERQGDLEVLEVKIELPDSPRPH